MQKFYEYGMIQFYKLCFLWMIDYVDHIMGLFECVVALNAVSIGNLMSQDLSESMASFTNGGERNVLTSKPGN